MTITAIILSGGRATRMGGINKGLIPLQGKALIAHVIARLTPQVDEIFINANQSMDAYKAFNLPVLKDENADFIGPLAGFNLGLKQAKHDYLLTVPCDSPMLPLDLCQRLLAALKEKNADIAIASSQEIIHPIFSLCKKSVLPSLTQYLDQGDRRVSAWQKSLNYVNVEFSEFNDAFTNINTLEQLAALEAQLDKA
jgi:molybdopterin-guanine dinucleotide biosynthesis protein A